MAAWVREACSAIAEAHALGIVHRDIKPANLFLAQKRTGDPMIKVLDFGISKLLQDTRITQSEVGMGSAEYMSPEQMRSAADVDARTDVWSLGVTLYELCTGKTPFRGDGVGQVAVALMTNDPVPPRVLRPDLPAGLEAVILRCLEKDPERRYASAVDLATALAPFARPPAPSAPSASGSPWGAAAAAPPAQTTPSARPNVAVLVGIGVAVVGVVVVILAFAMGRGAAAPSSSSGAAAVPSASRYTLDASTLRDGETKLTWQRSPAPGAMDWAAAKAYCMRQPGFRLPDVQELVGLLAVTEVTPPLDPTGFPTSAVDVFWSATQPGPGVASVVHFSTGRQATSVVSGRNRARCVR